jgi:hypothetical protein
MMSVREPAVAGQFYPSDPVALAAHVDALLSRAAGAASGAAPPVALIAPHAGFVYSGAVAASAFSRLAPGAYDRVAVVAPSHRVPMRGSSIYDRGAYRTPLGTIPVDEELARALLAAGAGEVRVEPELHRREHSLEVLLPFLQRRLGAFQLLPIVMGRQDEPHLSRLAEAIVAAFAAAGPEARILLAASSDLSHDYPDETARAMDGVLLESLERFDPDALYRDLQSGRCEACGGGPIVVALRAARRLGATAAEVVSYGTSGDVNGDRRNVVGYAAAALYREARRVER